MVDAQLYAQLTLCQVRLFSHFPQKSRQLAVTLCLQRLCHARQCPSLWSCFSFLNRLGLFRNPRWIPVEVDMKDTRVLVFLVLGGFLYLTIFRGGGGGPIGQLITEVQPPVEISLTRYLVFNGYYVNVFNASRTATITGVIVTYTSASGNTRTQTFGTIRPGETETRDPADVDWIIEKHESIGVSAQSYFTKTLETDILIDQLSK
jgi:hypothetical protein